MLFWRRKNYNTGDLVLGLNDALVEMLGALTGFTFALKDPSIIASAALIMGVAASLSMAASNYLASCEDGEARPVFAASLTGMAYFAVVLVLVLPYLLFSEVLLAWEMALVLALGVVFLFNVYASRVTKTPFRGRFLRMFTVGFGVTFLSYLLGLAVNRQFLS